MLLYVLLCPFRNRDRGVWNVMAPLWGRHFHVAVLERPQQETDRGLTVHAQADGEFALVAVAVELRTAQDAQEGAGEGAGGRPGGRDPRGGRAVGGVAQPLAADLCA